MKIRSFKKYQEEDTIFSIDAAIPCSTTMNTTAFQKRFVGFSIRPQRVWRMAVHLDDDGAPINPTLFVKFRSRMNSARPTHRLREVELDLARVRFSIHTTVRCVCVLLWIVWMKSSEDSVYVFGRSEGRNRPTSILCMLFYLRVVVAQLTNVLQYRAHCVEQEARAAAFSSSSVMEVVVVVVVIVVVFAVVVVC
jgi:hypothetical protein